MAGMPWAWQWANTIRLESEEIQSVHVEIHALEKALLIIRVDPIRKDLDFTPRIDLKGHLGQYLGLVPADGIQARARLPVEIGKFEDIQIGDVKFPDTQANQGQQMKSPHPAHAGDGDPFGLQAGLLGLGNPTDVA